MSKSDYDLKRPWNIGDIWKSPATGKVWLVKRINKSDGKALLQRLVGMLKHHETGLSHEPFVRDDWKLVYQNDVVEIPVLPE